MYNQLQKLILTALFTENEKTMRVKTKYEWIYCIISAVIIIGQGKILKLEIKSSKLYIKKNIIERHK